MKSVIEYSDRIIQQKIENLPMEWLAKAKKNIRLGIPTFGIYWKKS